jgi:prepilin-type N-terminal cleavage/methylation domain-containing protein
MSRFIKKQGFTLIELMVVIVIIGVLASLAIPRFTEASAKAKIAEAPRVLASYESAYLAAVAENSATALATLTNTDLIFESPTDSKWFTYTMPATDPKDCTAAATSNIGKFSSGKYLKTAFVAGTNGSQDTFKHTSDDAANAKKMVPNFCGTGNCTP